MPKAKKIEARDIAIGDRVRSFDFPEHHRELEGPRACYVEGVVEAISVLHDIGCPRYTIRITRVVWAGTERDINKEPGVCFPPVNGVPSWLGGVTDGVELLP